jgi:prevent-host-death family protein
METIGIRELKARASAVVERAENGESIVVSRNGRPVAVLLPFQYDLREVLLANADAVQARWEAALGELSAGRYVEAADLREAVERERRRIRAGSASTAAASR